MRGGGGGWREGREKVIDDEVHVHTVHVYE